MKETEALLKELTETPGVSGFEQDVRELIAREIEPCCDSLWEDPFGNLIARVGPPDGYKVGVYAHMDEVGLVVKKVLPKGLLSFELMGMIDDRVLPGSQVVVCGASGQRIPGVIGNKSKHLQTSEDRQQPTSYRQMVIDVGADTAEEALGMGVSVGCQAVFSTACTFYQNGRVLAKALDDRVGCLTLMTLLEELRQALRTVCVYGIFTVQEEVGARGAAVAANGLDLDLFIALDTAPVLNGMEVGRGDIDLGLGPVVRRIDAMPELMKGMISNRAVVERILGVAGERGIPCQTDVLLSTFLDSCTAQLTGGGLPGGSICFPRRYSHTAVEMCSLGDIHNAIALLRETILSLDREPIVFGKRYK